MESKIPINQVLASIEADMLRWVARERARMRRQKTIDEIKRYCGVLPKDGA